MKKFLIFCATVEVLASTSLLSSAFVPVMKPTFASTSKSPSTSSLGMSKISDDGEKNGNNSLLQDGLKACAVLSLSMGLLLGSSVNTAFADTESYDGFADYAKDNQMEKSDVSCFMNKCGDQTKNLFSNPRGIKGVSCLGRCKGEQECSVRCFAEFGSADLNNWLSCTIEENECVKIPKNIDNSAENLGYSSVVKSVDPKTFVGSWYKTDGLNPNYDLFDCQ